jgi:hypothetical protein
MWNPFRSDFEISKAEIRKRLSRFRLHGIFVAPGRGIDDHVDYRPTLSKIRGNMKRIGFVVLLIIAGTVMASAQQRFVAALRGNQEVPANASPGSGSCQIVLNAAETQITVSCTFTGLGSNAMAAHIHGSGAVGVIAPVLFGFTGVPAATSGSIGPLVFSVTAQQVADMRAHKHYVNIHTVNFSGGEIRGQIKQVQTVSDDDGDGRTDVTVFRPSTGEIWVSGSLDGSPRKYTGVTPEFGNYLIGTLDFDGLGIGSKVFINFESDDTMTWSLFYPNPFSFPGGVSVRRSWGNIAFNDSLVPADYDGDGNEDIAIFRRSTGDWWIMTDHLTGASYVEHWGSLNDQGCVGDYDGDGKADLCAGRPESGQRVWYIRNSSTGQMRREVFGLSTDALFSYAVVDVDGDGKQDLMTIRNVSGQRVFHILRSSDGQATQIPWGLFTDDFLFGDYDGDGKTDFVARRVVGGQLIWYILRSSDGAAQYYAWGLNGDR